MSSAGGARATGERVMGLLLARVTDVDDPEGLGRIRVRYEHLPSPAESQWAPVAAPMAGPDRGFLTLPEPDDLAVVGFLQGDLNVPVVMGFVWNAGQEPPASERSERRWRSVKGHTITLSDDEEDGIVLEDAHGNRIAMNSDGVTIEAAGTLKITASSSASAETSGTLELVGNPIQLNP
jgi:uncharacterized protein involved in type VI secretion and phage assembly